MTDSLLRAPTALGRVLEAMFLLHAALLPISIAAGQVWAYLIAVVTIVAWARGSLDPNVRRAGLAFPILLFASAALFSAFVGLRPDTALRKMDRLLLAATAIAAPWIAGRSAGFSAPDLIRRLISAFLIGCSAKAAYDLVRIPLKYWIAVHAHEAALSAGGTSSFPSFYSFGNMRDPQFYAAAICIALALGLARTPAFRPRLLTVSAALCSAALIIHFKRGAWASLLIALLGMALLTRRWRMLAILAVIAAAVLQFPMVQERLGQLRHELSPEAGGRVALWVRVAPSLFRDYPLGIGWRSVRHEDLLDRGAPVQNRLNHLHNNVLHVRLETGWFGLLAWLWWMGSAAALMVRASRAAARAASDLRGPALGVLCAFAAVHANGVVEYNFGDAEIFMLMNLLAGLGAALWVHLAQTEEAGCSLAARATR